MAVSLKDIQKNTKPKADKQDEGNGFMVKLNKLLSTEIGGSGINDSFKESFYGELGLLLEAGMNIKSALDLMTAEQKKEKHKKLLAQITLELTEGARFSDVLEKQNKFTAYEHYSIKIGEETGNLVEILKRLSTFYDQKIQQRRAFIGALTYPGVIMGTAVLAVTFMLTYMVPLFEDIFARMGGDLPWLTQIVINVSKGFGEGITSILIFIFLIVVIHYFLKDKEWYKRFRYGLLLKIPLIGTMTLQTYTLRFVKSMSLLINSKVNLTGALELSEKMVRFYPISYSLEKVRKMILQGSSLNEGLAQFKIYNSRFVTLVKVGEESNQLSLIFSKLADQMEEELQHRAKMLGNTLEPLIIVFLGFFVAVILIAMYLPMFQLSTSIGF